MATSAAKTKVDIMTPERLRAYWFGDRRVPFWDYDPKKLTIGIEIEYFIAKIDGQNFTLATKAQYLSVISNLVKNYGYYDRNLKDQPGRVSKDTANGFIAIKPDFAWHILEIALPPRKTNEELRELLTSTFAEVDQALAAEGLERLDISCLPEIPEKMELVELDRLSAHVDLLKSRFDGSKHSAEIFPALIAATHIHLNVFEESMLPRLPSLYQCEEDVLNKFSREQVFNGELSNRHRSKFYEATLGTDYILRTIPQIIPSSLVDYCALYNKSYQLFPNDSFYPVRDLTYIRPTRYGTIEFRSACSFKSIERILELTEHRKRQIECLIPKAAASIGRRDE